MTNKILCAIGLHEWTFKNTWLPNFNAKIIEEHIHEAKCIQCGKYEKIHTVWNGSEMVDVGE